MVTPLPERAADTTASEPWPVRLLSMKISEYVDKMSALWVEGQIVQLTRRPGATRCYLTLRDPDVDMSLSVSVPTTTLDAMPMPLNDGARVVVQAKPVFYTTRGSLHLDARQIRPVGVGELLARLEHLKRLLAAEGLFEPARKKPLPFLPRGVGLITGRAGAAQKDVVDNARRRWPGVRFVVREVPVQGPDAVLGVTKALADLDRDRSVDVIVIARGGGGFEDLLPFSNESLVRAVAAAVTPVVSAIGHEIDTPLVDFVADVRASTPTDAAKRIVPDMAAELHAIGTHRDRARRAVLRRLESERHHLATVRARPVLADPAAVLVPHRERVAALTLSGRRTTSARLERERDRLDHLRSQVRALSPGATMARGYAIVAAVDGSIVRSRQQVTAEELLRVRVTDGDFGVRVVGAPTSAPRATTKRTRKVTS